jgi:DeoR family transcriptional regulator, L-fucose operon activator
LALFRWISLTSQPEKPKFPNKSQKFTNSMLAIERQRRILDLLNIAGSLRTIETAESLGVTDETVRKDFELLEKRGELIRIHGGASRPEKIRGDLPFTERQAIQREAKQAIARLAASRIQANETIFLDASSTVLTLTEFLPDLPLTILTNALNVLTALSDRPNLDLMCTGGLFDAKSRSFIGLTAEKSLQRYNIHRAFLSGSGLHPERGVSESNARQAAFKERVISYSQDVVFMADHTKLGRKASFFFAQMTDLSCVITDRKVDLEIVEELRVKGVEVLIEEMVGP